MVEGMTCCLSRALLFEGGWRCVILMRVRYDLLGSSVALGLTASAQVQVDVC